MSGEGGGLELAGINEDCLAHLNPIPPRLRGLAEKAEMDAEPRPGWTQGEGLGSLEN